MANLQVKDGANATKYLKASGTGTDNDPHVPEHKESNSAAILAALSGTLAVAGAVTGPLTDAQLRATAVPVSGPVTDAQLRATPVPVSGTVTASGPLTDAQLRATAVPVSGAVTIGLTTFEPETVTGYASNAGPNTAIAAPGAGKAIELFFEQVQNASSSATVVIIKHGNTSKVTLINANKGDGYIRDYGSRPRRLTENTAYVLDLDLANQQAYVVDYRIVTL